MKTLSDKICNPIPNWNGIYIDDVKQFIKDLKEESYEDMDFTWGAMVVLINKLAGDKLI